MKRILWVGEASYLSTGYATYGLELLRRLHASGKYNIAELASYGDTSNPNDRRWTEVPWKFFPVMPNRNSQQEIESYRANPSNQHGEWKFEEACLKHRPHVVMDCRDWWYMEYQERSPFRRFYNWAIMPAVDAAPQNEQWLSSFLNADAVFTYSDWGADVLREQSHGRIRLRGVPSPGADLGTLHVKQDRKAHRRHMGMDEDCFIVGTVMRNQKRKLYPDLIKAFAQFLREAPQEIANKTYLYMHTSWPDIGWDIPLLISEAGIAGRCLFTYFCKSCGASFPSFFQDARTTCRHCGKPAATMSSSQLGVSRKTLCEIMNSFDVYVQYANSEGFGMPMVEAAACGVPVFAVDYSAMSDVVRKLEGIPIPVERLYRESETGCNRALPDNSAFVKLLTDFFQMPAGMRQRMGYRARKMVEQHYTYDRAADIWMSYLDSVEVPDDDQTWQSPANIFQPQSVIPEGMSNRQFVEWGLRNIAGRPELVNGYVALRMLRDLTWGCTLPQMGGVYFNEASSLGDRPKYQLFNREICVQEMHRLREQRNHWERKRCL